VSSSRNATPAPVLAVAIRAKSKSDEDKLANALHRLLDEGHVRPARCLFLHLLGHPFGSVADDHDRAIDIDVGQGVDDVHDHRAAAHEVQWLGPSRPHSLPLAGRQHDR